MMNTEGKFTKEIEALKHMAKEPGWNETRQEALKQIVLSKLNVVPEVKKWNFPFLRYAMFVLVGILIAGGGLYATEKALPGTAFYKFKKIKESVELSLAQTDEAKAIVRGKHAEVRLSELQKMNQIQYSNLALEDIAEQEAAEQEAEIAAEVEVEQALSELTKLNVHRKVKASRALRRVDITLTRLRTWADQRPGLLSVYEYEDFDDIEIPDELFRKDGNLKNKVNNYKNSKD